MDDFHKLNRLAKLYNLQNLGFLNLTTEEINETGVRSIVLLGPNEPQFWRDFTKSSEKTDNLPHPLDRWTKRVLSDISTELNTKAFFPFDGPPYWPFYSWALRSGESFRSPINFLVHVRVGLFISFRGAIGLQHSIEEVDLLNEVSPCESCEKPCIKSCPVEALTASNYDDRRCKDFVAGSDEDSCSTGCLVRRACPVGRDLRLAEQSKFHMSHFIKN